MLELDPGNADALLGLATLHLNNRSNVQQARGGRGGRRSAWLFAGAPWLCPLLRLRRGWGYAGPEGSASGAP